MLALYLSLVTLTFVLFTPKINGFPGLIVEHVSSLVILAAAVFLDIMHINR